MRREDLPEEEGEFKDDIGDVEDGQQPLISCRSDLEVFLHPGNDGITDVSTVESIEHV